MQSAEFEVNNCEGYADSVEVYDSKEETTKGYIKELIIENFKSYKGKHIIGPFSQSLTCIVGPNGSGKSNLMDALSFALGLSSNDMRSTNLKDLIYHSEEEEMRIDEKEVENTPLNNVNYSNKLKSQKNVEVSLIFTLLNQNKDQIKFSRKIALNGTSRFILNGEVVSQETYFRELASFNILVKARNFLVFQGDVEDIAQRAPKELTQLFEKISGSDIFIQEYDRLSNEQSINQIISHNSFNRRKLLEAERRELQKQIEEVKEYEKLINQKKEIQLEQILFRLYCNEISGGKLFEEHKLLEDEMTNFNQQINEIKHKIKECESKTAKDNIEWRKLNKKLETLQQEQIDSKNQILKFKNILEHYKSELKKQNKSKEQMSLLKEKNEKLIIEYRNQIDVLEMELKELAEIPDSSEFLKVISSDIQEYINCKRQADIDTSGIREDLLQIEREKSNICGLIEILEKEKYEIEMQILTSKTFLENVILKLKDQEEKLKSSFEDELKLISQIKELEDNLNGITSKINSFLEERNDCEEKVRNINAKKDEVEKEMETKELIENLKTEINSNYGGNSEESFVLGRLSDMCHSNNRQFSSAVDSALGKYSNYIVVTDWETAKNCIFWLKRSKKKPMEFLPLDSAHFARTDNSEFDANLRALCNGNKSIRSLAKDNIHVSDERILPILNFCLKGVIFTHTLNDAKEIFYKEAPKLGITPKVITLDGEKIMKNGNLCLDSNYYKSNSKNLAKEYTTLSSRIESLNEQISNLEETELDGQRKLSRFNDNLKRIRLHKTTIEQKINIYERNINEKKSSLDVLEKKFEEKGLELKSLISQQENLNIQLEKLRIKIYEREQIHFKKLSEKLNIDDISLLEQNSRKQHDEILQKKKKLLSKLNILNEEFENFLKKQSSINEKLKNKELEIVRLDELLLSDDRKLNNFEQKMLEIEEKLDQTKNLLKSNDLAKKDSLLELESKKKELSELQQHYAKKMIEKNEKSEELEILNNELISLFKIIVLENIEIPLLSGNHELIKKYWEYFELNSKNKTSEIEPPIIQINYDHLTDTQKSLCNSQQEMNKEISRISNCILEITEKIEQMNPNMKARDKIKEIDAQLDALLQDQKEIRKKSMEIDKLFKALRKKRTEAFMKCFEAVKEAVGKFYSQLTCEKENIGGQAFLDLDDTNLEEPFACGIIFHAMPPSKRFRDIRQLSGGEKTMAALALLFAMQSYHPSPFFVLDEVDAALDPQNVHSIASFLKKAPFQSIVISLKDKLFSQADVLIGVYKDRDMKTSAIITLNLNKYLRMSSNRNREESFVYDSSLSRNIEYNVLEKNLIDDQKNNEKKYIN